MVTRAVLPSVNSKVAWVSHAPSAGQSGGVVISALPLETRTGIWKSIDRTEASPRMRDVLCQVLGSFETGFCVFVDYGYTRDEFVAMNLLDFSLDPAATCARVPQLLTDLRTFETVHRRKDDRLIDISVSTSVIEYGGRTAALSRTTRLSA